MVRILTVAAALKTFKREANAPALIRLANQLHTNCQLTLRLDGLTTLHSTGRGVLEDELRRSGQSPSSLKTLLESVVQYYRGSREIEAWDFMVRDLRAIANRNINLARDLPQVAQLQSLIDTAGELAELDATLTLGNQPVWQRNMTPAQKAEVLVGIRALCGPRSITIGQVLQVVDAQVTVEGTFRIEGLIQAIG